jgi:hypothetical protein
MTLNQLYFDHQLLMMNAEGTPFAGKASASAIAGRIACIQRGLGASGAPGWEALATLDADPFAPPSMNAQGYAS